MEKQDIVLNQFDVVRLLRADNVKYLSAPPGRATAPRGEWSVVGFIDRDCLLAKQTTIIRVHPSDVAIIARYNLRGLVAKVKETGTPRIDVTASASKVLNISSNQVLKLCKEHRIPTHVDSQVYEKKAIERLKNVLNMEVKGDGNKEG
jgi:hypothetical protein